MTSPRPELVLRVPRPRPWPLYVPLFGLGPILLVVELIMIRDVLQDRNGAIADLVLVTLLTTAAIVAPLVGILRLRATTLTIGDVDVVVRDENGERGVAGIVGLDVDGPTAPAGFRIVATTKNREGVVVTSVATQATADQLVRQMADRLDLTVDATSGLRARRS